MKRIEYAAKMALGFLCYHLWITLRVPPTDFVMGWAGFYGYDDGFDNWLARVEAQQPEKEKKA